MIQNNWVAISWSSTTIAHCWTGGCGLLVPVRIPSDVVFPIERVLDHLTSSKPLIPLSYLTRIPHIPAVPKRAGLGKIILVFGDNFTPLLQVVDSTVSSYTWKKSDFIMMCKKVLCLLPEYNNFVIEESTGFMGCLIILESKLGGSGSSVCILGCLSAVWYRACRSCLDLFKSSGCTVRALGFSANATNRSSFLLNHFNRKRPSFA